MGIKDPGVGTERRRSYSSSQGPFHDAGNLLTFFAGGERGAIVDDIVRNRRGVHGVVHVHGESGSGRTFLSHVLADRLKHACNVIRHDPTVSSRAVLLRHLLIELCPMEADLIDASAIARGVDELKLAAATERIVAQLGRPPSGGKPYLLVVDCPGNAEPDLDAVALLERLAGVRRGDGPAMQVVLFRLADPDTVREAITLAPSPRSRPRYWLRRLTLTEVHDYLRHRMMLFDFNRRDFFDREMSYFVADRTDGVFGRIGQLVRDAFTLAGLEDADRPSVANLFAAGSSNRSDTLVRAPLLVRNRRLCVALLGIGVVASVLVSLALVR